MKQNFLIGLIFLGLVLGCQAYEISNVQNNEAIKISQQKIVYADQECNITHFQFQSNVSLGKNDQLNLTFTQLGERIRSLKDVTWKANDTATYTLTNAVPKFYYRDSKQKAQIVGNDTIVIDGGFAQVTIEFSWSRTGSQSRNGTATVFGLSDEIIFAKDIIIDGDFFRYDLLDYMNVTFDNPMNLTRISPPETTEEDRNNILKLVNNILNITTLRHQLQDQIALSYPFLLKMNLHNENTTIDQYFEYKWTDPTPTKGDLIIQFKRRPVFIDIERDGIHYGYEARIQNYSNSKCGPQPPKIPLNPSVYGGSQQFISYVFYENVLRYAIEKGQMNTDLNKHNWENRMFQFYAGDLYEVFPHVAETYIANTQVLGKCNANTDHLLIYKSESEVHNTFNVTMHTRCELNINKTKILDFDVGLQLTVQGVPSYGFVDFRLKSHTEFVSFYEVAPFKIHNELLARQMVSRSINRLYEHKLFGSGWPLHPERDYPHFETQHDATVVYDSSHVASE